jgi:hypothetical protein
MKSISFLQYSSQEEPLTPHTEKHDTLERAISLLTKAAEQQNSDALYLLGELNFVYPVSTIILIGSTAITQIQIIPNHSLGSKSWLRRMEIVQLSICSDLCMQQELEAQFNRIREQ